jgi:YHS domain-containing protein
MLTKNGVELDLRKSKYKCIFKNYIFYFSSEFYLKKFKENLANFIFLENTKISNRYKIKIDLSDYLSICYYKKIEKRGFRVIDKNTGYTIDEFENFI